MTEGENLRMERSSGAETLPKRIEQREDDRENIPGKLSGSRRKFNWLNQHGVFGRDRK
jgi:hypothetical protein